MAADGNAEGQPRQARCGMTDRSAAGRGCAWCGQATGCRGAAVLLARGHGLAGVVRRLCGALRARCGAQPAPCIVQPAAGGGTPSIGVRRRLQVGDDGIHRKPQKWNEEDARNSILQFNLQDAKWILEFHLNRKGIDCMKFRRDLHGDKLRDWRKVVNNWEGLNLVEYCKDKLWWTLSKDGSSLNKACFERKLSNDPIELVYTACNWVDSWAILQKQEASRRNLQLGTRLLKQVANDVFNSRHGWMGGTRRIGVG
uniref:Reverse transcriptase zinc-binding domain-containing protein n=1 Tax=Oryza rufipogon TaxID=4529 RepID=A0A0E0QGG1_ORYRU